jgi:hypothetical protein
MDIENEGRMYLALEEDIEQTDSCKSDRFWLPTGIYNTYLTRNMARYYWKAGRAYSFIGWQGQ